jgi:hypothetical protein
MSITVHYLFETSDHDGCCSGNECEYDAEELEKSFELPSELGWDQLSEDEILDKFETKDRHLLQEMEFSFIATFKDQLFKKHWKSMSHGMGSGYCDLSDESLEHNLERHDARIVIFRVVKH